VAGADILPAHAGTARAEAQSGAAPGSASPAAAPAPVRSAALDFAAASAPAGAKPVLWGYVDGAGVAHFASHQVDSRYGQVLRESDGPRVLGKTTGPESVLTWLEFSPAVK